MSDILSPRISLMLSWLCVSLSVLPILAFAAVGEVTEYELYRRGFFEGYCQAAALTASADAVFALGGYFWEKKESKNWLISFNPNKMTPNWKVPMHSSYDPILKSNSFELLYLTYGQGQPRTLNAVDLKSGELRWSKEASSFSVLTETRVLIQTVERREKFKTIQRAAILDAKTGDLIKTLPAIYEVVSAFEGNADDQSILFNKKTGEIARVNLETGFVSDVQNAHVFSPVQVVSLGLTLLLSTQESKRRLLAYSLSQKRILWERPLRVDSNITSDGERVVVLHEGGLESIDVRDGKTIWLNKRAGQFHAALKFHRGQLFGFFNRSFNVIDRLSGKVVWSKKLNFKESSHVGRPIVLGPAIYAGTDACQVIRVALE